MGLGREGSISIAYLILLSRIPLDCAFGWRCRGRGPCRCVYARPNDHAERCTVCTMASLPFPFSIPAHDTVSEWSWIFRRKSSDRQIGDRNERVAGTITSARTVARRAGRILTPLVVSGLSYTPYRHRTTGMCSARQPYTAWRPPALTCIRSSQQPIPLIRSHSRLHFRLHPTPSTVDVSDPTPNSGAQSRPEPAASATHSQLFLHFVTASGLPSSRSPWIVESV
jgi:hypothetical protein